MKYVRTLLIAAATAATLTLSIPSTPAYADGAASTRNLILLGGAATYLIVEHNRKVHEREAQAAQRQAADEQQSNDAWAAYHQEARAYQAEVAENAELKREVAYQHRVVEQQQHELASLDVHEDVTGGSGSNVAMVSYGWGTI